MISRTDTATYDPAELLAAVDRAYRRWRCHDPALRAEGGVPRVYHEGETLKKPN
jgi:hypothetical protein